MLETLQRTGLVWPTILTALALAVLISLGGWQWQRKAWKEGLLEQLAAANKAPARALSEIDWSAPNDLLRFRRVRVGGHYVADGDGVREAHVWSPDQSGSGWRVVSPMVLDRPVAAGNRSIRWVPVIRGRVDEAHKQASTRPEPQITAAQSVVGRLRQAAVNWATPAPDPDANQWYGLDHDGIVQHFSRKREGDAARRLQSRSVLGFFVEAESALAPPPAPQPDLDRLTLHNRHLEYALTWWGLAVTLIGVYVAFAAGRMRAN